MATQGITHLQENTQHQVMDIIKEFNIFDTANDPYQEHDFGTFSAS